MTMTDGLLQGKNIQGIAEKENKEKISPLLNKGNSLDHNHSPFRNCQFNTTTKQPTMDVPPVTVHSNDLNQVLLTSKQGTSASMLLKPQQDLILQECPDITSRDKIIPTDKARAKASSFSFLQLEATEIIHVPVPESIFNSNLEVPHESLMAPSIVSNTLSPTCIISRPKLVGTFLVFCIIVEGRA